MSEAPTTTQTTNQSPVRTEKKPLKKTALTVQVEKILDYLNQFYFEWQGYPKDNPDYLVRICKNKKDRWEEKHFSLPQVARRDEELKNFITDAIWNKKSLYNSIRAYSRGASLKKCGGKACFKAFKAIQKGSSRVLLLDIDKEGHEPFTIEEFEKEFRELLKEMKDAGIKFVYYNSGRGVHIRILLDEPLSENEYGKVIETLAQYHREILKEGRPTLTIDTQVGDLARVFRTVGSYNHKNPVALVGSDMRGIEGVTEKKKLLQFVKEKEGLLQRVNEAEKTPDEKFDIYSNDFENIAKKIAEIWKPYYREGTRQNLALLLAGILKKYTVLDEDKVEKLFREIIENLKDDEEAVRLGGLQNTLKKDNPATITLFFLKGDKGEIIDRSGRLEQFCSVNNLSKEQGAKTLEELIEKTRGALKEKGLAVKARGLIGRKQFQRKITRKGVVISSLEVYKDKVKLSTARYNEEEGRWEVIGEDAVFDGSFRLRKIEVIRSADKKAPTKYFTIDFVSKNGEKETLERVTLPEMANIFASTEYAVMKSTSELKKIFQGIISILKDKNNIQEESLFEGFEFEIIHEDDYQLVTQKSGEILNNLVKIDETAGEVKNMTKLLTAMNCIKDDKLLFLLAGTSFSAPLNEFIEYKPIIWIYGPPSVGKTSSARIFTEKAWGVEAPDAVNITGSNFRLDYYLKVGSVPLLVDDISEISYGKLVDSLKSYATRNTSNIRGKADLTIEQYKRTASLIFLSNYKLKLKRKDEAFLDRVFQYEVQEQVFDENCPRGLVSSLPRGIFPKSDFFGLIFYKHPKDLFYEKAGEIEEKVGSIIPSVTGRRAEFWAKLLVGLIGFRNFLQIALEGFQNLDPKENKELDLPELKKATANFEKRLDSIIEKAPELIKEIESTQDDDTVLAIYAKDILRAIVKDSDLRISRTKRGKEYFYVTRVELEEGRKRDRQKIRSLFERIDSLNQLKKALEALDSDFVEIGRYKFNNKKITALQIDAEVARNLIEEDEWGGRSIEKEPTDTDIGYALTDALDAFSERGTKKIVSPFILYNHLNEKLSHFGPKWSTWTEEDMILLLEQLAKEKAIEKVLGLDGTPTYLVADKKKFLEKFPELLKKEAENKLKLTETPETENTNEPMPPDDLLKRVITSVLGATTETDEEGHKRLKIDDAVRAYNTIMPREGYPTWGHWTRGDFLDVVYYLRKDGLVKKTKRGSMTYYYIIGDEEKTVERFVEALKMIYQERWGDDW
ncbi:hypothetical protein [Thermococcus henrietii]|uniref:hypothetical protein n=1 Tax=Thermococcus henrietii TaxID=2016361 RepID=UPI000C074A3E|nr:hypothetical protein [Thermococcus henrietii]